MFSNAGANAIGAALQFALLAFLARILDIDQFAGYISAVALIAVVEIASDFGVRVSAIRRFSLQDERRKNPAIMLVAKIIFSCVAAILLALFYSSNVLGDTELLLCVLIAVLQPSTDILTWHLRGRERLDIDALIFVSWRLSVVILISLAAFQGVALKWLLVVWLLVNIIRVLIVSFLKISRQLWIDFRFTKISSEVRELIIEAFPIGVAFFLMAIYQRLGVFVLERIGGSLDVALYGAAFTLVASSGFIATSITLSNFPRLVRYIEDGSSKEVNQVIHDKIKLITILIAPFCLIGAFLSPFVVDVIYGDDFSKSSVVMILLLPGLYISCINFSLKFILNAMHLNWIDAGSVLIGIFVFVAVMFTSVLPKYQLAAFAWVVGEMMVFFVKLIALNRFTDKWCVPWKMVLSVVFVLFISSSTAYSYFYLA